MCFDGRQKQTLIIESMRRFRVGRNMFAACIVDLYPEHRTLALVIGDTPCAVASVCRERVALPPALAMESSLKIAMLHQVL